MNKENLSFCASELVVNVRLDQFLHQKLPTLSRTRCQQLIAMSCIKVNNVIVKKASLLVNTHMTVTVSLPQETPLSAQPSPVGLDLNVSVVAEHDRFMIINKPAGLIVHQASTTADELTLVDWIRARLPYLVHEGDPARPGIVHRLDKDTSGLMIIPKDREAHALISDLFKEKKMQKKYLALVTGHPLPQGAITYHIMRHPTIRIRMTHSFFSGRDAYTGYVVEEYFEEQIALISCLPKTGRTHQIRVHCAAIGHPILGDSVYGKQSPLIARQALHAAGLSFTFDNQEFSFYQEPPEDFQNVIAVLSVSEKSDT